MEKGLKLMQKAIEQERHDNVKKDAILVWINYVKTGDLKMEGVGELSREFLNSLKD